MSVAAKEYVVARINDQADTLAAIREQNISIAIWERNPLFGLSKRELNGIADVRFTTGLEALPDALEHALDAAEYIRNNARDILQNDILQLSRQFAEIMQTEFVEVRLEHITNNACKKFHTDYVTARLITTYLGQGTQWLDGRDTVSHDDGGFDNIQQMRPGDVALLKGRLWSQDSPAIHRSPPIEGTGEERLMLVINPVQSTTAV